MKSLPLHAREMNSGEDSDSGVTAEPSTRAPSIPYARAWKIALRTVHLMAISALVGGHIYGAEAGQLMPSLYLAMATGAGMAVLEAYPSFQSLLQGWCLFLICKLALLCAIPFAWRYRALLMLAVVALSAVGSHLPARFRHYSLWHGKVIK